MKKSEFALRHALSTEPWHIPRYIADGLAWLAENNLPPQVVVAPVTGAVACM